MSKPLTIGNETFQYPEEGTKPGWGEEATSWAVAVTDKLGTLSGVNDINCTCLALAAAQECGTPIGTGASALSFPTASVRSFVVDYAVTRGSFVESGNMEGVYDGTDWCFNHCFIGDADVCFDITAGGHVRYFTKDAAGDGACSVITGGVAFADSVCVCCVLENRITRTLGSWVTDGFYVGGDFVVSSSEDAGNNGTYTVTAITPTVVTVTEALTNSTAAPDETAQFDQSKGAGTIRFRARTIDY